MKINLKHPVIKFAGIILVIILFGIIILSLFSGHSNSTAASTKAQYIHDSATSDTPVETLKTLTAEVTTVQQQNQKLVEQNKVLIDQDQKALAQLKTDVLAEVQQKIESFKADQAAQNATRSSNKDEQTKDNYLIDSSNGENNNFIWVSDLQGANSSLNKNFSSQSNLNNTSIQNDAASSLLNSDNNTTNNSNSNLTANTPQNNTKNNIPYYTLPVNATLTGAIAMQPLIGRVPIDGKVPDPYTFKLVIGPKNLAANGVDIPSDIQGIVASGVAEGDMLGSCARGEINSMTFVFTDGRISTTQAKNNESLGTIAAANGNPCIQGIFYSNAGIYLGAQAALAGIQGYGNALSQSQLSNTLSPTTGASISQLIGNANKYAFGQSFSNSAQAAQHWWNQRVQNSFDFVYVPNVDPNTKEKLKLNINITQEIPIDYNHNARKVFYNYDKNLFTQESLN